MPAASTRSARRWSWWVTPSVASMMNKAASARSIACERAHEAVVLGRLVDAALAPQSGGVDEAQRPVVGLDHRVDRVARRAGHVVHDRSLLPHDPVEERRLADVRPADDRDREDAVAGSFRRLFLVVPASGGSAATIASSNSPDKRPCSAETAIGSPSPSLANGQISGSRRVVVDLVDGHDHRRRRRVAAPARPRASSSVTPTVTSTTSTITSADAIAASGLRAHLGRERRFFAGETGVARSEPAAGVDHGEAPRLPLGVELLAVARHARLFLDDRVASPDDAVDERRLADVGSADDRDDRRRSCHAARGRSAATSEAPSVGTTSTGPGRSASVVPSRKRPRERDVGKQVATTRGCALRARARGRHR